MDADLSISSKPAKHNWLNRITKGMTSGKSNRYKKLELSTFDSPGLGFQVQEELARRNEIGKRASLSMEVNTNHYSP